MTTAGLRNDLREITSSGVGWAHKYRVIAPIHKGTFSTIFLGQEKSTGRRVVLKEHALSMSREATTTNNYFREGHSLHGRLRHTNIVQLLEPTATTGRTLVMEHLSGGDLFDCVIKQKDRRLNEVDARRLLRMILNAVHHLHAQNIVHRDLKPENVLLTSSIENWDVVAKITDFDLAVVDFDDNINQLAGSIDYMAPEVLLGKKYGRACDMWSIGCIAYVLLGGILPFDAESKSSKANRICSRNLIFYKRYFDGVSLEAINFMERLMSWDPAQRMSANEALRHPWMLRSDYCSPTINQRELLFRTPCVSSSPRSYASSLGSTDVENLDSDECSDPTSRGGSLGRRVVSITPKPDLTEKYFPLTVILGTMASSSSSAFSPVEHFGVGSLRRVPMGYYHPGQLSDWRAHALQLRSFEDITPRLPVGTTASTRYGRRNRESIGPSSPDSNKPSKRIRASL